LDETLSPTSKVEDSKDLSALAPPGDSEISDLTDMMVQIQLAKEEAMKHGDSESSRDKLIDDINYLYGLLMKAKEERMQLIGQQGALKDKLKRQKVAHEKLQAKKVQDKIIFVEMLKVSVGDLHISPRLLCNKRVNLAPTNPSDCSGNA